MIYEVMGKYDHILSLKILNEISMNVEYTFFNNISDLLEDELCEIIEKSSHIYFYRQHAEKMVWYWHRQVLKFTDVPMSVIDTQFEKFQIMLNDIIDCWVEPEELDDVPF